MSNEDRRKYPRFIVNFNAILSYNGKNLEVRLSDISQGGAHIIKPTDWTPKPAENVDLKLVKPGDDLELDAEFIWSSEQSAGIKFVLDVETNKVLETLINSLQEEALVGEYVSVG